MKKKLKLNLKARWRSFFKPSEYKKIKRKFRYSLKVRDSLRSLLLLRIREALPDARLSGHDKKLDDAIRIVGMKLAPLEGFDEEKPDLDSDSSKERNEIENFRERYNAHKERLEEIINSVENNEHVQAIQKKYWLVSHHLECFPLGREELAKYYMEQAKKLDPNAAPLTDKSLLKIYKDTKKEIKQVRSVIANRGAWKISIDFSALGKIAVFIPSLFFISGYFYNKILLGYFDIDVSNFFSVEDYITSNIEKTESALLYALLCIFVAYIGFYLTSRKSIYQIEQERKSKDYGFIFLVITSSIGSVIVGYMLNEWLLIVQGIGLIGLVSSLFLSEFIATKCFKRPIGIFFCFFFLCFFFWGLAHSLLGHIYALDHEELASLKKYEFTFSDPSFYPEENMVLIANGKEFYIFRDVKSKTSIVVPRQEVISVKSIEKASLLKKLLKSLKALIGQESPKRLAKLGGGAPEFQDTSRPRFG